MQSSWIGDLHWRSVYATWFDYFLAQTELSIFFPLGHIQGSFQYTPYIMRIYNTCFAALLVMHMQNTKILQVLSYWLEHIKKWIAFFLTVVYYNGFLIHYTLLVNVLQCD